DSDVTAQLTADHPVTGSLQPHGANEAVQNSYPSSRHRPPWTALPRTENQGVPSSNLGLGTTFRFSGVPACHVRDLPGHAPCSVRLTSCTSQLLPSGSLKLRNEL